MHSALLCFFTPVAACFPSLHLHLLKLHLPLVLLFSVVGLMYITVIRRCFFNFMVFLFQVVMVNGGPASQRGKKHGQSRKAKQVILHLPDYDCSFGPHHRNSSHWMPVNSIPVVFFLIVIFFFTLACRKVT